MASEKTRARKCFCPQASKMGEAALHAVVHVYSCHGDTIVHSVNFENWLH